jgi:hypothetical protein
LSCNFSILCKRTERGIKTDKCIKNVNKKNVFPSSIVAYERELLKASGGESKREKERERSSHF